MPPLNSESASPPAWVPSSPVEAAADWATLHWCTPFGRFFKFLSESSRAWRQSPASENQPGSGPTDYVSIYPLPLPFESVGRVSCPPERRRQRKQARVRHLVNLTIASLNFFALGAPKGKPHFVLPDRGLSAVQQSTIRRVTSEVEHFCAHSGGPVPVTGRGRSRLQEMVMALQPGCYGPKVDSDITGVTVAMPVISERISLPSRAGHLRLAEHLPPERARVARDLSVLELDRADLPAIGVKACHRIDKDEERAFFVRLLDCGMATLVEERDVYRHPVTGKAMVAGLFAVPHKPGRERLIVDRRPGNQLEKNLSPKWLWLPHSTQLGEIVLDKHEMLRGSCDDLECWFYQIGHEEEWALRQAVGRRQKGEDWAAYGAQAGRHYRLAISVVAMGDHNGCAFAQAVHEWILEQGGLMKPEQVMRYGRPPPLGSLWEGTYIDDHLLVQRLDIARSQCTRGCSCQSCTEHGAPPDVPALEKLEKAYESFDVAQSTSKRIRYAPEFEAWGSTVRGRAGKVGVHVDKRRQIARLLYAVARAGHSTKSILQSLLGCVSHPFLHRRLLMSVLGEVFLFTSGMPERGDVRLPAAIIDELLIASLLIPFAEANLRNPVSTTVSATDATPIKAGRCAAVIPKKLARVLFRRCEGRGEHGHLNWTEIETEYLPTTMTEPSADLDELLCSLPWKDPIGYCFKDLSHINIQECVAVLDELERQVRYGFTKCRYIIAIDSRVCVGAIGKGRSSSVALNKILRKLLATALAADVDIRVLWVSTKANPADAPSRDAPLPARGARPDWSQLLWENAVGHAERTGGAEQVSQRVTVGGVGQVAESKRRLRVGGVRYTARQSLTLRVPTCREYYAGTGHCSAALRRQGLDTIEFELFDNGVENPLCNMVSDDVVSRQIRDIGAGLVLYSHFGIVCSSWGIINRIWNGGTRTREFPMGNDTLQRERLGNLQLKQMMKIICALVKHKVPFTIENPIQSLLWQTAELKTILGMEGCESAVFDQCVFGLRPPDSVPGDNKFVRKRTRIVGILRGLSSLSKLCQGGHEHVHAVGSAKVNGRWIRRSSAAAAYPAKLCNALSFLVNRHVQGLPFVPPRLCCHDH